jgi:membrane-associated protease RseP (regulator of RpoE activity)
MRQTPTLVEPGQAQEVDPLPVDGGPEPRRALLQLLVVVAAVVVAAIYTNTTAYLIVIVALVIMVMLHELGHFATAKWSHMKVTEYFLGFGPRLWSVRSGETEYGIKAIPAGGYVKIIGMTNAEEVDPKDEPRTYREQPFHNRVIVAVAGSAMHFLMAFVLIWSVLVIVGTPVPVGAQVGAFSTLPNGKDPARAAGLTVGDVIVGVDGHKVSSVDQMIDEVSPKAGQRVTLTVQRHGKTTDVVVTPEATKTSPGKTAGRIGVEIEDAAGPAQHSNPLFALGTSVVDLGHEIGATVTGIGHVFSPTSLSNYFHALSNSQDANKLAKSGDRVESIYGAVRTATQGAQAGSLAQRAGQLIAVLVAINIFVGLFNLHPMLPLDGGHVAVAVYERVRSRGKRQYHADVTKLMPVAYAFVLLLGFVVVSSLYLDITHPVANPFQ